MKLDVLINILVTVVLTSVDCAVDHCGFHEMHLFCGGIKGFAPACGSRENIYFKEFSQEDKDNVVRKHNEYRNNVASGVVTAGPKLQNQMPKASNMQEMRWDDELAQLSQEWVKQCSFVSGTGGHTCAGIPGDPQPSFTHLKCLQIARYDRIGECLYYQQHYQSPGSKDYTLEAIAGWFDGERKFFSLKSIDYFTDPNEFGYMSLDFGHMAQVIWHDSILVGCATIDFQTRYGTDSLVACHYAPTGVIEATQIYEKGEPCSNCPNNQQCSSAYPALCSTLPNEYVFSTPGSSSRRNSTFPVICFSIILVSNINKILD